MTTPIPTPTEKLAKMAQVRELVQSLRQIHHTMRHAPIAGCAECIVLKLLEDHGF